MTGPITNRIPKYTKPDLPPILSRKDWDKKKGVFAKLVKGKTGIGEQCDAVAKAYKSAAWADLDLYNILLNNGFDNWKNDTFNRANLDKQVSQARAVVSNGSVRALFMELSKLAALCRKTETNFRNNKKIPKASADHCKEMAAKAEFMAAGININTYNDYVGKVYKAVFGWVKEAVVGNIKKTQSGGRQKLESELNKLKNDPQSGALNTFATGPVRSLNQALGNIAKFEKRFGKTDGAKFGTHFDKLQPYARGGIKADDPMAVLEVLDKKIEPLIDEGFQILATWDPPAEFK